MEKKTSGSDNRGKGPKPGHTIRWNRILGAILSAGILSMIFVPFQKAEAFVLDVSVPAVVNHTSAGVPFSATLDIIAGEFISIETVTVLFDEDTPDERTFVFDNTGERISGNPASMLKKLTISSTSPPYGYSYAYGYGLVSSGPVGSGSPITNGQIGGGATNIVEGFAGPTTITFSGTLKTNKLVNVNEPTTHTVQVSVDTSAASTLQHLVSDQKSFTVNPKKLSSATVEAGESQTVTINLLSGRGPITISFSNVNGGGDVVVEQNTAVESYKIFVVQKTVAKGLYAIGTPNLQSIVPPFDIDMSGVEDFSFPVDITIQYDEGSLPVWVKEKDLRLLEWTGTGWEDITIGKNPGQNTVTGRVLS